MEKIATDPLKPFIQHTWHEAYIELQADPGGKQTDKAFCEEYGIHKNTLLNWKRKYRNSIHKEVGKRRNEFVQELRTKAYKALYSKLNSDTAAIKLCFQLMGDLVEKSEQKIEHGYMTREDKIRRIDELLKGINKKKDLWQKAKPLASVLQGASVEIERVKEGPDFDVRTSGV